MDDVREVAAATQEELREDLRSLFRGAIRLSLEMVLHEEIRELVGARRFERISGRKDFRNGTYLRRLLTSMGMIDVAVPRTRSNGSAGAQTLGEYRRRMPELDAAITEAYVSGVSTRKIGEVTDALLGERVSRSTVSRVTRDLETEVEKLRTAPITDPIPYLYLDATFLDARWARRVENISVLVAYGVAADGHRRLLAVTIGAAESEESWAELIEQLLERGLAGVRLVIADAHRGLAGAVRRFLPEVKIQRCTVHLERNVLTKVPQRLRARVARELSTIFNASSAAEAKKRAEQLRLRWTKELPEAMACLADGIPAATQFYAFPKQHWTRIRSTNGLERLHGEIKRRIRAVGAFPDRASALRLVTAVAVRTATIWGDRRYLDVSSLVNESKDNNQAA
jgi:putative transposase